MGESIQKRLGRVRPPRVQITYDVEVGDAIVKKELPFVMGIMADLAGDRTVREDLEASAGARVQAAYFCRRRRDNFDDIMKTAAPRSSFPGWTASLPKTRVRRGGKEALSLRRRRSPVHCGLRSWTISGPSVW
ncbi:MAG: type VI secretion system contractile sheath small subunit [Bilophila wadsworthia]